MTAAGTGPHGTPEGALPTTAHADDVLTIGRMGVDIYPLQVGTSLRHVESFGKFLGGSPANVAVAAARLGRRAALISRTGADPFGEFLHDALQGFGVDDRYVTAVPDLPTPRLRTSMPRSTRYWMARRVVGRDTPRRSARSTSFSMRAPTPISPFSISSCKRVATW